MSILLSGYSRQCNNKLHVNQDKFGGLRVLSPDKKEITLAALADGISMGFRGELASYNTILWLLEWASEYLTSHEFNISDITEKLQSEMKRYNHMLNDYSDVESDKDTCCTICGIVTDEKNVLGFNGGDSRLYRLSGSGEVQCMTKDDRAADGHSIAMHIGGKYDEEVNLSFFTQEYNKDDIYVLCSDGFYTRCNFPNFGKLLGSCHDRRETVEALKTVTNELVMAGEKDDITALIIANNCVK